MDEWFSVDVSDPGQDYWNMEPIAPTWDNSYSWGDTTPTYDYSNYDSTAFDQYGNYDNTYSNTTYDNTYDNGGYSEGYGGETGVDYSQPQYGDYSNGQQAGPPNPYATGQQGGAQGGQQQQQGGYGQPQQQQQQQNRGLLGGLLGGGQQGSSGGGFGDMLGTLGGLALVGGVGALLGSMLSGKSGGKAPGGSVSAPAANYLAPKELASPGVNPGYAMGGSSAPAMGSTTSNLGKVYAQPAVPQTNWNVAGPNSRLIPNAPMGPSTIGQPLSMAQVNSLIGL